MANDLEKKNRSSMELTFVSTTGDDPDFEQLCFELDQALDELVGTQFQRSAYDKFNTRESIHDVIIAYDNKKPVACGSFKKYDEKHAELKRIYTNPSYRDMGLGKEMVKRLEEQAKNKGFEFCILETGKPLMAACHMYQKIGYKIIKNYGQYADMENSICMQKEI